MLRFSTRFIPSATPWPPQRRAADHFLSALLVLLLVALLLAWAGRAVLAQDEPAEEPITAASTDAVQTPTLLAPEDGAQATPLSDPPVGMPTLRWSPVPGATRYQVQISASQAFGQVLVDKATAATAYTPEKSLADGPYYWRVRAEVNRQWSFFSAPWLFTKDWSAGGAVTAQLLAPDDDPVGEFPISAFQPDHFRWEPVPGAATYWLEISSSPTFNNQADRNGYYAVETIEPRHTPISHLRDSVYYWRVTPRDNQNNAGASSPVRSFTYRWDEAPLLVAPASNPLHDAPIQLRFVPRFAWEPVLGAAGYRFELSTEADFSSLQLNIATANTDFAPETALANNKDYYWRVKAIRKLNQGEVTGPPSEVRRFNANWVSPPQQLTPDDFGAQHTYPYFSWTPVAGAEKYRIKIWGPEVSIDKTLTNATAYTQPEWKKLFFDADYFWQVQAIDARGNTTDWSEVRQFQFIPAPPPNLIYPEHHYAPDAEGIPVHTDRTIAYPLFVWDTMHVYAPVQSATSPPTWISDGPRVFTYPDSYLLEVANDESFGPGSLVFGMETAGQAAAPTLARPFDNLVDGALYYWRVTPLRNGAPLAWPSTAWPVRIDRNTPQLPIAGDGSMNLYYPPTAFESVAIPPVLGWQPVADAHHYRVEISRDAGFTRIVDSADALFANYVPWQGRLEAMPPAVYWWRVQAQRDDGSPLTPWSETRYFVLSQELMIGNEHDYKLLKDGTLLDEGDLTDLDRSRYDPALSRIATGDAVMDAPYGLGSLHLVDDRSLNNLQRNWVLAFEVAPTLSGAVDYAVYIDVNRHPGMGGSTDPRGKVVTIPADSLFKPDHIIYFSREDDTVAPTAQLVRWGGSDWLSPVALNGVVFHQARGVIQLVFPYTAILRDTDKFVGSVALTVVSSAAGAGAVMQSAIPPQHTPGVLDSPALASNMLTPLFPFNTPLSNPTVYHELPSLRWRSPHFNSNDGYQIQVARDVDFTTVVETWETFETNTGSYYAGLPATFRSGNAYTDDESYFWRVRRRHERYVKNSASSFDWGPWSPAMRFKLSSYQVGNPRTSLGDSASVTPAFLWERVEGAAGYTIQISSDSKFVNLLYDKKIDANSFVPTTTLPDGVFYWRVAMRRSNTVRGQWTEPALVFNKLPMTTTLLGPVEGTVLNQQPTFTWSPVLTNSGELRVAAPRYRLQWDTNPSFTRPTSVETAATSYTPLKGQSLADGTWYWRVTVIDASNRLGANSQSSSFYKEYLPPSLVAPTQGELLGGEVQFVWSPIPGAAAYEIEVADNEPFNRPVVRATVTDQTRFTPLVVLPEKEYYWRVRMRDKDGRTGPYVMGRFSSLPQSALPFGVHLPQLSHR